MPTVRLAENEAKKRTRRKSERKMCSKRRRADTAGLLISRANIWMLANGFVPPLCGNLKTIPTFKSTAHRWSMTPSSMTRLMKFVWSACFRTFSLCHIISKPWQTRTQKRTDGSVPHPSRSLFVQTRRKRYRSKDTCVEDVPEWNLGASSRCESMLFEMR